MKVLIIGGMGLIGGAITESAISAGYNVTVLSRRAPFDKWINSSATFIQADWKDDCLAKEAVSDGFDVIVDTQIFNEEQMARSLRIVNNHCKQFIYISTDSVYAHPNLDLSEDDEIVLEDIKWKYGIDKRKAELFLISKPDEYSFNWSVVRPTLTFGNTRIPVGYSCKRGTYALIDRIEKQKPILRFDNPDSKHALCHVSVFGDSVVSLFLNKNAYGSFFHISDNCSYTYDEIFNSIEKCCGEKAIFAFVDSKILKKYNLSIYEEMIYDKNPEFTLDNSKIKELCPNVSFHIDLQKVIQELIYNLRSQVGTIEEDDDYNKMTDLVLIKGIVKNPENRKYISNYTDSFSKEYRTEIKRYGKSISLKNNIQQIKEKLSKIKRFIIK